MSGFKPEVKTVGDPDWYANSLTFATYDEAFASAKDLSKRWTLVVDFRAIQSINEPTHTLDLKTGQLGYIEGRI